ncbi:MAG TPA: M48 family metalloprotease [Armatimonadota bacterium]|nr:M48 family metalloprotease [Armatimonadota bacterium]
MLRSRYSVVGAVRAASIIVLFALTMTSAQAGLDRSIEKTLGRQARSAIESQYKVVQDGAAAEYVQRVGATVVATSPRHDIAYTFSLLDTEQINAFALPWGYVYVTTGMLNFVDSSDQLAGVMGHEIGHVAEKHSLDAFKKQFWTSMFFGVIDAPATLATLGQVGATLYLLRHSRKDEQAADTLGAGYAYAAGYDPSQLAAFLRKLDAEHGRKPSTIEVYLSTHPTGERRQERLAEVPQMKLDNPQVAVAVAEGFLSRHLVNQAVVAYRRAVRLAPDDAAAQAGLARAYAELGEVELARQAQRRVARLSAAMAVGGADLATQAPGPGDAVAAAPPSTPSATTSGEAAPLSPADELELKRARAAAGAWGQQLQEPARALAERAKSLDNTVRGLARRMNMAGAFATSTLSAERVMEKAQYALYMIAETSDRIEALADGMESSAAGAAEVAEAVERGFAAPSAVADRAQWRTLAADITDGIARTSGQSDQARQQALGAADLADRAAAQLGSALSSLSSSTDVFGTLDRGFAFVGLAEGEVDDALGNARNALGRSGEAMATLHGWRADELSWRLSAAYLEAPPGHRPALRSMAVAMIGESPQTAATEEDFGAALLRVASGPGASPSPPSPDEKIAPAGPEKTQAATYADLMLKLVLADVTREAQARKEWRDAPAPK